MINTYFNNKIGVIAGAAGFIGSHMSDALLEAGATIIGLDSFLTGRRENLATAIDHPNFHFHEVDLIKEADLLAVLATIKNQFGRLDFFLHLASPASPPVYQHYPCETYLVNSLATHNILTWLKQNQPQARFLFASTSEVYGDPLVHPQKENYWGNVNPNGVRSCYDEAKRLGETIAGVFYRQFGLDTRLMRIFNTYGPRMDLHDGRVLPQFIQQALNGEKLTIYGDGNQTRSYCYISDLVAGVKAFLATDNLAGETINLGNPGEYTIKQTADIFLSLLGRDSSEVIYQPLPSDDPKKRQPDIGKAKRLLSWEPQIDFRQGLQKMLISYQLIKDEQKGNK